MNKRPVLYLVAGLICAGAAVLVAQKYLPARGGGGRDATEIVKILIATETIDFGAKLVVSDKANDVDGNCAFADWPKQRLPAGHILAKDGLGEEPFRAGVRLVKHQVIQQDLILPERGFVPSDSYGAIIEVDAKDMAYAQPGKRVDVFAGAGAGISTAMSCALVLPPPVREEADKKPKKDSKDKPPQTVRLLILKKDSELFLRATAKGKLRLQPAKGDCAKGMTFVAPDESVVANEPEKILRRVESYIKAGQYADAYRALKLMGQGGLSAKQTQARNAHMARCELWLAKEDYRKAQVASEQGRYDECLALCNAVAERYPSARAVIADAQQLAGDVALAKTKTGQQTEYERDVAKLQALVVTGNIPAAREQLAAFEEQYAGYEPPAGLTSPREVADEQSAKLKDAERDFRLQSNIIVELVKQGARDKVRAKFEEMKQRYPAHPKTKVLEDKLREKKIID